MSLSIRQASQGFWAAITAAANGSSSGEAARLSAQPLAAAASLVSTAACRSSVSAWPSRA
jgi:hypothetical protein